MTMTCAAVLYFQQKPYGNHLSTIKVCFVLNRTQTVLQIVNPCHQKAGHVIALVCVFIFLCLLAKYKTVEGN